MMGQLLEQEELELGLVLVVEVGVEVEHMGRTPLGREDTEDRLPNVDGRMDQVQEMEKAICWHTASAVDVVSE